MHTCSGLPLTIVNHARLDSNSESDVTKLNTVLNSYSKASNNKENIKHVLPKSKDYKKSKK